MRRSMVSRATVLAATVLLCAGLTGCGDDDESGSRPGHEGGVMTLGPGDVAGAAGGASSGQDGSGQDGSGQDSGAAGGGSAASCVAAIEFRGRTYVGVQVRDAPVGATAGEAVTPPCNDTGDTGGPASEPFPVLAIDGVDPSVAVATRATGTDGYWVWYASDDGGAGGPPDSVQALIDAAS